MCKSSVPQLGHTIKKVTVCGQMRSALRIGDLTRSARSSTQTGIERPKGVLISTDLFWPRGVARVKADGLTDVSIAEPLNPTRKTPCSQGSFRNRLPSRRGGISNRVRMNVGQLNCWAGSAV